ncbi:Histone-lysine N-methyltransferase ASHR1 [Pseudolycoriella hygida]|uniref:Histone-lysine N-methyltransferase ASHR1 n=1 Tax=Pseudolycoriella hygida TaxID=35572 RepID=A0A9Q0S511_9DIPT|nr:Histone-lysine N-methyltransferase ASHR1 [Pseudolycoriella hygida]
MRCSLVTQECPICSQPATKRCTTCKKVSYCSQEHQIEDWKNHKPNCLPYIVTDKTGVKILVLRRDVQKGEIILDEKPLFHIPEYNGTLIDSICAGCGLHMETENIKRCSICRWPVCGTECANSSIHQNFECKHFRSTNFKYKTDMMTISTLMLLQIRARTLKIEHPATWTALNELMTGAMYYHDEWTKANMAQITKFLKKTLPNVDERQRKIITADAKTLRAQQQIDRIEKQTNVTHVINLNLKIVTSP